MENENLTEDIILIPKERVGVLIGKKGETKKKIEKEFNVKLNIDEEEVSILRKVDDILGYKVLDVVKAIGRGFSPENAMKLKNEDVYLDIINLKDFENTPNQIKRVKSRIIGEKGKVRKTIEELTGAKISVFGKTVAIIGTYDQIELAKEAIYDIIDGKPISMVYKNIHTRLDQLK